MSLGASIAVPLPEMTFAAQQTVTSSTVAGLNLVLLVAISPVWWSHDRSTAAN